MSKAQGKFDFSVHHPFNTDVFLAPCFSVLQSLAISVVKI